MRKLSLKALGIIAITFCLISNSQLSAQTDLDDFGFDGGSSDQMEESSNKSTSASEADTLKDLINRLYRKDEKFGEPSLKEDKGKILPVLMKPTKDPFKPLIEKEAPQMAIRKVQEVKPVEAPKKPAPPPVKPIKLFVSGIVGNEGSRLAIVKFENEELTIAKDQIVEGKFKVVDIYADRVVVYSNKEQRRHTFKIGGDEK